MCDLQKLYLCLSHGAIYADPEIHRAAINRDECVECYAGFNGLSQEHPNPVMTHTVSASFAKKMIDWVKEGRRSPGHAASYMARFCSCGVFNASRAAHVLEPARSGAR